MYNTQPITFDCEKYIVGSLTYDAMTQSVSGKHGTVYLRQKLNQVFHYMVTHRSRLISREELVENFWEGNFYTGVKAVTHTVCKLRKTLEELEANDVNIRTLPKQGYTLFVR